MARGNTGAAALASVLQKMAQRTASALDQDWMCLGTILADGSLRLDNFTVDIPPDGYMRLDIADFYSMALAAVRSILLTGATALTTDSASGHSHGVAPHTHATVLPELPTAEERGRELGPGDRVLCCSVNMGTKSDVLMINPAAVDIVVLGRVYWNVPV